MGAGKTTIGRQLAKRLGKRFVDCDQEIEARTGVRIPVIFEIEGEEGFRRREAQVVFDLTNESDIVLATGGGAILYPENRACLAQTGLVVYLCVPADELFGRTRRDINRPLLQVDNPKQKIADLYVERDPLYREIADIVIDGGSKSPATVVRLIEQEIQRINGALSCNP